MTWGKYTLNENPRRSSRASTLSDEEKRTIEKIAKRWRGPVRRGDVTAEYAAEKTAGEFTYPYATAAHFEASRKHAERFVR